MENEILKLEQIQFTENYIGDVCSIIETARKYAKIHVNYAMVHAYYLIGKRIVVQEQNGQHRAEYGKEIVKNLSDELSAKYGKGYSTQSLYNFRLFYESFLNQRISPQCGEI